MHLHSISINNVRRICSSNLSFSADNNLIFGANGSGKTTVLESIHLLAGGRSFRTGRAGDIIRHKAERLIVSGQLENESGTVHIGVEKTKKGTRLKKDSDPVRTASEIVRLMPILILNSDSYQLLDGGPSNRRTLLDRLLFHVEHDYLELIKKYYHIIKQRNAALRQGLSDNQVNGWDEQLVALGSQIDEKRVHCVNRLNHHISALAIESYIGPLNIGYESGWKKREQSLHEALNAARSRDRMVGSTTVGPHRGELKIRIGERAAKSMLSRGQGKLVVTALIAALAHCLAEGAKMPPILLIDDLAAEFDGTMKSVAIQLLTAVKTQAFFTAIEYNTLRDLLPTQPSVFHVEQGAIEMVESPG